MKKSKKIIAMLIAALMVTGFMPSAAFADENGDAPDQVISDMEQTGSDDDNAQAIIEAEQAVSEAQSVMEAAQAVVDRGSLGFFEYVGNQAAADVIYDRLEAQELEGPDPEDIWGRTDLGQEGDATSLDNMKATFDFIREYKFTQSQ